MKTGAKILAVIAALMLLGCVLATWYLLGEFGGYSFTLDNTSFTVGEFSPFERIATGVGIFVMIIVLIVACVLAMVLGLIASLLGVACAVLTGVLVIALLFSPLILIGVAILAIVRKPPPAAPMSGAAR